MTWVDWMSLAVLALCAATLFEVHLGARRLRYLRDLEAPGADTTPLRVSVVVPALNEADTLEPALRSLLASEARPEVVVVDDRSTDATPQVLARLQAEQPRLRVLRVDRLPEGWLGKNHALQQGAAHASGEWLLFTDADVVFEPSAIARAAHHCRHAGLDHLAVLPDVPVRDPLLASLMLGFQTLFLARFRPWRVGGSARQAPVGVGAFNMVRASTYRAAGGHAALPLAVIDDMALACVLHDHGARSGVMAGAEMVRVAWYADAGAMFRGLEKNLFAAFDYQWWRALSAGALVLMLQAWPYLGVLVTNGPARVFNLVSVLLWVAASAEMVRETGYPRRCLLYLPLSGLMTVAMWWRACWLTWRRGGVVWRGTHYPLDTLRRGHRPL
ncbi:glycosyltransferase [Caldimonas brevitalea]|uniref:Glycosyl transferase n=1 Tax=Caldimonas brevitalea TaxID=413882 RepID=A0A0G3BYD5_9BURK|nr:glycosyltransferase family 2 protein [Caldimonas brevitalea]AKJ31550.1 glycosyl transferase [Caldimonas brevitalea]